MKKLTTAIVGLGLFAGSAFAQDGFGFQSFYPEKNVDTPDYLIDNSEIGKGHQTLAKSTIKTSTLMAFFPEKNNDTPEFLRDTKEGNSIVTQTLAKSSVKLCTLASFYPEKNTDSPRAHISC